MQQLFCTSDFSTQPASPSPNKQALSSFGPFSDRAAYNVLLLGQRLLPGARVSQLNNGLRQAHLSENMSTWLAWRRRRWTSDRLAARGLQHQHHFPLCLQSPEMIDHQMVQSPFAKQIWGLATGCHTKI
jgi:hypothetical protein